MSYDELMHKMDKFLKMSQTEIQKPERAQDIKQVATLIHEYKGILTSVIESQDDT